MKWTLPRIKRNVIIGFLILCLFSGLVFVGFANRKTDPQIVASVNGETIRKDELYEQMLKQNGQQGLSILVAQKIVELEAKKQNIVVSSEDIQREMAKYYDYYGGKEAFAQALEMSVYSEEDIKDDMRMNIKIRKLLEPQIAIEENEMKTYFEENKDAFVQEQQVKASHILVGSKEEADEIRRKLSEGEDFSQLAKELSTDEMTKENGGQLGFFSRGQLDEAFEKAAFAMRVGDISAPVKTDYGYHIIKAEEKKEAKAADYQESKDKIREFLLQKRIEAEYDTWLQEKSHDYKIENYLMQN